MRMRASLLQRGNTAGWVWGKLATLGVVAKGDVLVDMNVFRPPAQLVDVVKLGFPAYFLQPQVVFHVALLYFSSLVW